MRRKPRSIPIIKSKNTCYAQKQVVYVNDNRAWTRLHSFIINPLKYFYPGASYVKRTARNSNRGRVGVT